ncbi:MAG: YhcH/YjgK/YiaL family protein [Candidatus Competibacteraceae bacterium]|nr:YhcH/YjgK/YiaL family protein [Candidatus Competibacteraceae bacterium]
MISPTPNATPSWGRRSSKPSISCAATDLNALAEGRHELAGDALFALVQDYHTKPQSEGFWEAHRRYTDLQFIVRDRTHRLRPVAPHETGIARRARDLSVLQSRWR